MRRRLKSGRLVGLIAVALLLLAAPLSYAAPQLLGQWHFDTGGSSGATTSPDSSGNTHDLSTGACPACIFTNTGGRFSSYLAEFSHNPALAAGNLLPGHVTVLAWVKNSSTPTKDEVIAGQAADNRTCDRMSYRLRYNDGDTFSGLEFSVLAGGQVVASPPIGTNNVWDGNWHFVAGTYDGSKVRLYVDGNEVGSGTSGPGGNIEYGATPGKFGVDGYTGDLNCVTRDFEGGVDELRVYSEALTPGEIADLASNSHSTPPTLIVDSDDDGVGDSSDNCPTAANTDQADGDHNGVGDACQDLDGDSLLDIHDNCSRVANANQADSNHDGVGDACDPDSDGVPNPTDNCPDNSNRDQRDDNHDGVGHACQPPAASLRVAPNPTCTSLNTQLDGSASTGGDDPITDYHMYWDDRTYATYGFPKGITYNNFRVDLGHSTGPFFIAIFYWNLAAEPGFLGGTIPAQREPVYMQLDIRNAAGETASTKVAVYFAQQNADQSRNGCKSTTLAALPYSLSPVKTLSTGTSSTAVSFQTNCRSAVNCLGSATLSLGKLKGLSPLRVGASAAAAKPKKSTKNVIVGATAWKIPHGKTGTIRVKLNKTGLKLLRKRHKLTVVLTVLTTTPTGKTLKQTKTITLRTKTKKKKKK